MEKLKTVGCLPHNNTYEILQNAIDKQIVIIQLCHRCATTMVELYLVRNGSVKRKNI